MAATPKRGEVMGCRDDYAFGRDETWFPQAARAWYADSSRPLPAGLLTGAPRAAKGLVADQIVYRRDHPACKPALYLVTLTLETPDGGLHPATKLGKTTLSIAARLHRYKTELLGRLRIVPGSQVLRLAVFGDGDAMPWEGHLMDYANKIGMRTEVGKSDETFVGAGPELADEIYARALERAGK